MMVDLADRVLIVWDGKSRGTRHTLTYAQKHAKPHILIQA
jgi:hypothetical protein